MGKKVDVVGQYTVEIVRINNKLNHLEKGNIYDLTQSTHHGTLATHIKHIRGMLNDLVKKIEYEEEGDFVKIKKVYDKYHSRAGGGV